MGCLHSSPSEDARTAVYVTGPTADGKEAQHAAQQHGSQAEPEPTAQAEEQTSAAAAGPASLEHQASTSTHDPSSARGGSAFEAPGLGGSTQPSLQTSEQLPKGFSAQLRAKTGVSEESKIDGSRPDNSLALLQKVLNVGMSDVVVHTQAWGLKHIGFGPLKKENQDEYFIKVGDFGGQGNGSCYCVFDGHGTHGASVSAYCQRTLPTILDSELRRYHDEVPPSQNPLRMMEDVKTVIKQAFVTTERNLRESGLNISSSGTTASLVLQLGAQVWVAAVGDSRVISIRRLGNKYVAQPLTLDHRPSRNSEKARVVAAGGRVEPKRLPTGRTVGEDRLWLQDVPSPGLLLSRSIGDAMASSIGCTAEPEVIFLRLQPQIDCSVILATDGVWDVLTNDQVCQIVSQSDSPDEACQAVLDTALEVWEDRLAADNISVVVAKFLWPEDSGVC